MPPILTQLEWCSNNGDRTTLGPRHPVRRPRPTRPHQTHPTRPTARELAEELGATARIGPQVFLATTRWGDGVQVQHFFLAHLINIDTTLRTGPEYADSSRGTYELDRIPPNDLPGIALRPIQVRDFIIANTEALLADLPASSHRG